MHALPESRLPLEDLLVFHKMARSLTSSLDRDTILGNILEQMHHFVDVGFWALLLLDPAHNDLYYFAAKDIDAKKLRDLRVPLGEGLAGWVAANGETLLLPEAAEDPRVRTVGPSAMRIHSAVAIPIRGRRGTHGVLEILNPALEINPDSTIALLHILADYAAIAIENAQDVAQVQRLTITDDVTGLYNARHLYQELDHQLAYARDTDSALSLVFLDLDKFKAVNDQHGHLVGSETLRQFGQRLRQLARPQDICFRYGGDEFVIVMPGAGASVAAGYIRSLHAHLTATVFDLATGLRLSLGSSVGLATYPTDGRTVHAIIGVADKRMYEVKASGRGRVAS